MAGRDDDANPFAAPESDFDPDGITDSEETSINYASFWQRFIAAFVDNILLQIIGRTLGAGINVATENLDVEPLVILAISLPLGICMSWLYEALQESSEAQATLGKRMMGIIVTDMSGQRISFGQATGRYFAKIASFMTCLIGYLMQPFTEQKQALHDLIAQTLVVKA